MLPPQVATTIDVSLSIPVLAFAALLSLGTGVLFGIVPALQSTRPDLVTELRNNSGKLSGGRGAARFRTTLVTAQIALSMALLISAGLFIKSLRNIARVDLGIKIDNVVTFGDLARAERLRLDACAGALWPRRGRARGDSRRQPA